MRTTIIIEDGKNINDNGKFQNTQNTIFGMLFLGFFKKVQKNRRRGAYCARPKFNLLQYQEKDDSYLLYWL